MEVRVLTERCQGHNRCVAIAPELFDLDEYGKATARAQASVSVDLAARAVLAAQSCPESAIDVQGAERAS